MRARGALARMAASTLVIFSVSAVTLVASFPNLLVVRPAVPANDVQQLIGLLRANPGKYSYATSGTGTWSGLP